MKEFLKSKKFNMFLVAFILFVGLTYAQPTNMPAGDGLDVQDEAPITSLLLISLVAGAAYGIKKLK